MMPMLLRLGAPVTEPQGNSAAKMSAQFGRPATSASTLEVICHTVG
ncbi:hypothetical protein GALL_520880 [mine drainage metagenome]|uniref:Uncharacterized protein n=1 Tax=mine drainage metagenome TaxID=410659 RepID=A0A1J5P465_9ZZZZ